MLTSEQVSELHRLHFVEKWPTRKIARHLYIGRRTIAKYLDSSAAKAAPAGAAARSIPRQGAISELLERDPEANAPVIAAPLKPLGYDGGLTIIKDHLHALRKSSAARRAYVRVEYARGERFDID
jgi:hypothetical protein